MLKCGGTHLDGGMNLKDALYGFNVTQGIAGLPPMPGKDTMNSIMNFAKDPAVQDAGKSVLRMLKGKGREELKFNLKEHFPKITKKVLTGLKKHEIIDILHKKLSGEKIGGMLPAGHQPPRRAAKIMSAQAKERSRIKQNFSDFLIDVRNTIPTLRWLNQEKKEEMLEALQNPPQVQNLFHELDDDNTLRRILTIDNIKNIDRQFYDQTLGEMIIWIHDNLE
jgi:hypothetical protein